MREMRTPLINAGLISLGLLAASSGFAGGGRRPLGRRTLKVVILSFGGCPTVDKTRALVQEVVRRRGARATIRMVDVPNDKSVARLGFFGSPTVRVDGRDIERAMRPFTTYGLACRLYRHPEGMSGLPPRAMVEAAIDEALAARRSPRRLVDPSRPVAPSGSERRPMRRA